MLLLPVESSADVSVTMVYVGQEEREAIVDALRMMTLISLRIP
jgi:hypothetical protein